MSELRKDPMTGRWVIVAPERLQRPNDYKKAESPTSATPCPFCPGHEEHTPPEILARRTSGEPNAPGWTVRVIPNQYPALRVEGELQRNGHGLYDRMTGVGAHEVIVETAEHGGDLPDRGLPDVENVLSVWSERLRDLSQDLRLRCAIVFKNFGEAAGASLVHPHSQLLALPVVPAIVAAQIEGSLAHFKQHERCLLCDIVRFEKEDGARVVWENDACVVLAPWASRAPFETWIVPKAHASHFEQEPALRLTEVAEALRTAQRRLAVALEGPAYNLVVSSGLLREDEQPHFHWHIELLPSVAKSAGFEVASGYAINPVPPEEAAAFLRGVKAG